MEITDYKELIANLQDKEITEIGLDTETSGLSVFTDRLLLLKKMYSPST
jgi:ribonuclease D